MSSKPLVAVLLALALAGCGGVDPNSPQGKRQALFKQMMKVSEDMGGMLRGRLSFDAQAFAAGARELDALASQPWQHFPQVREEARSSARDEVWQRQERFQQLARELEQATAALVLAVAEVPLKADAVRAPMQRVEDSCEGCHQEFRAY
ncbi:c-type cytochrome [Pseudomonas fluvialis]|uniref:c-type cytochrome n=1 Tax=Pseudomonas fluvialis TaxID=1793966 RepID=UPI0035B0AB61